MSELSLRPVKIDKPAYPRMHEIDRDASWLDPSTWPVRPAVAAFVMAVAAMPGDASAGGAACRAAWIQSYLESPPREHPLAFRELVPPPTFGKGGTPEVLPEETLYATVKEVFEAAGIAMATDAASSVPGAVGKVDGWSPEQRIGVEVVSPTDYWLAQASNQGDEAFTGDELAALSDGGVLVVVPWDERLRAVGDDPLALKAEISRIAAEFVAWSRARQRT